MLLSGHLRKVTMENVVVCHERDLGSFFFLNGREIWALQVEQYEFKHIGR